MVNKLISNTRLLRGRPGQYVKPYCGRIYYFILHRHAVALLPHVCRRRRRRRASTRRTGWVDEFVVKRTRMVFSRFLRAEKSEKREPAARTRLKKKSIDRTGRRVRRATRGGGGVTRAGDGFFFRSFRRARARVLPCPAYRVRTVNI